MEYVGVVGSREFPTRRLFLVRDFVQKLPRESTVLVSGGADGVDRIAEETARICRLSRMICEPMAPRNATREQYRQALLERNCRIVELSTRLQIFYNGVSNGTRHLIRFVMKSGKPFAIKESWGE